MKKRLSLLLIFSGIAFQSSSQIPAISVVSTLVKKVVNALDLEVQRLQNKTIFLQDAQKTLENTMSAWQLDGIGSWVQQTKDIYASYYQELSTVKAIIATYDKVKEVASLESKLVSQSKTAISRFRRDKNFTPAELQYMLHVYTGILNESLQNVNQVLLAVNVLVTQMSDASRIDRINEACQNMHQQYNNLQQFNNQAIQLSLQRSAQNQDMETVKNLYGIK